MDLYTADLMAQEHANDRLRDLEAAQLAELARAPRARSTRWRERVSRIAVWAWVMRRGAAT
jgi:hypothetical protein